jgi:L-alanine-DL-glutamate epimerase-like enolase superfamily enzyme
MRIKTVRVRTVAVPDEERVAGGADPQSTVRAVVTLRMATDDGIEGLGIAFSLGGGLVRPLALALEELAELTVGEDPTRIEDITAKLRRHAVTFASSGIFLSALSAIDCALWDIKGKVAGLPLWRLLGGMRQRVPAYASGELHRGVADADIAAVAEGVLAKGFKYVKLHLGLDGDPTPRRELERAALVRRAVGPQVNLVADVNERWSVGRAIDIGRRLEEVGLYWLEDPTRGDDYAGLAQISASLSTPVMAGENCWGVTPFRLMLERRSVAIVMIDIMHVGGITPWMKIAALADAFNIPVVSHIMPEFQAQLVAAAPNGLLVEHKAWTFALFDGVPYFEQGDFVLSDRPGHGLSISRAFEQVA